MNPDNLSENEKEQRHFIVHSLGDLYYTSMKTGISNKLYLEVFASVVACHFFDRMTKEQMVEFMSACYDKLK